MDSIKDDDYSLRDLVVELRTRVRHLEENAVSRARFIPVELLAYGFAGAILIAVVLSVMKGVLLR